MLSKSQITLLKSLQQKKNRKAHHLFLAEGIKTITEFISSDFEIEAVYHTPGLSPKMLNLSRKINFHEISPNDIGKISNLTTPQEAIALIKIPQFTPLHEQLLKQSFSLVLDGIQDPGNLGTIIRTADWFGIRHIICSEDTVDAYGPKVVQATMGSLTRVSLYYTDLEHVLIETTLPVFGAVLNGKEIYDTDFRTEGLIVLGNEGNGIRPQIMRLIQKPVTIPSAGQAESLNVAIAAAIFCSEVYRKSFK